LLGHVIRREEMEAARLVMRMNNEGKRKRSKKGWLDIE